MSYSCPYCGRTFDFEWERKAHDCQPNKEPEPEIEWETEPAEP